jgi:hypothetical protein
MQMAYVRAFAIKPQPLRHDGHIRKALPIGDSDKKEAKMLRKLFLIAIILVVTISVVKGQQFNLRITSPLDKARVPERPYVEGTVTDSNAKVWVIVHPMEVSDYWVQPSVTVKENSTWKVKIYIGRPGSIDVGKQFEIMAVTNPKASLKEGTVLSGWPEAQEKSQVIEVTRR